MPGNQYKTVAQEKTVAGSTTTTKAYLQGPNGPLYCKTYVSGQADTVRWYVYDGLGSVVKKVDSTGTVTASRKYDVYGALRSGSTGIGAKKT